MFAASASLDVRTLLGVTLSLRNAAELVPCMFKKYFKHNFKRASAEASPIIRLHDRLLDQYINVDSLIISHAELSISSALFFCRRSNMSSLQCNSGAAVVQSKIKLARQLPKHHSAPSGVRLMECPE